MRSVVKKPELVAPAGDWCSLRSAVSAGADSVYFGVKGLNLRHSASNFDRLEIKKVMSFLHKSKKRGYLALNVIIYDKEIDKVKRILEEARKAKVDSVVLWDLAAFSLAKHKGLNIHLSTQASTANFLAMKEYVSLGARRIIMARECGLSDLKNITKKINQESIDCEIEAFIHGAMCLSISGRCFLSEYSFSKSANRGKCLQPCRREFLITDVDKDCQYVIGKDYLLSPRDLCTIDFIDELIKTGIAALKIEGRMRPPEYIKVVTSVYRRAIDLSLEGKLNKKLKNRLKKELSTVYNRGFSSGFYFGRPQEEVNRTLENRFEKVYLGEVIKFYKKLSVAEVIVRNGCLRNKDTVLCSGKNTPSSFARVEEIQIDHQFVEQLKPGQKGGVKLPFRVNPKDKIFIWRKKHCYY